MAEKRLGLRRDGINSWVLGTPEGWLSWRFGANGASPVPQSGVCDRTAQVPGDTQDRVHPHVCVAFRGPRRSNGVPRAFIPACAGRSFSAS